jgi:hypothetical protein
MLKGLLRSVLGKMRIEVRRVPLSGLPLPTELPVLGYDMERDAQSAIRAVQSHTMVPYQRLVVLYQQVAFCERQGIDGCYVECGTWRGGASGLMALANVACGTRRRHLHLFDSFEGIPEPIEEKDGAEAAAWAKAHGAGVTGRLEPIRGAYSSVGSLEVNTDLLERQLRYPPEFVHYHKGWFQDTVPRDARTLGPIAILRLDGDWYESTRICLEHLHEHVVSGGFVIMDDYNCVEGCKRATDEFFRSRNLRVFLHHLDGHGRYWVKP